MSVGLRRRGADKTKRTRINGDIKQRLVARSEPTSNGCTLFVGGLSPKGYGVLRDGGKTKLAHRVAYELHVGEIPAGLFVCHSCDNPRCIQPTHLFLGTNGDNVRDMMQKGRGVPHGRRQLTSDERLRIDRMLASGFSLGRIARKIRCSKTAVWKHKTRTLEEK